ncbi:MAG: CoA ester lyase [Euryarchaeota archaeon]|nr:CoA ester lyase [Euryarchaeota archaeon]
MKEDQAEGTALPLRLRRTMLYTPGTRGDRLTKAFAGAADMVVADLEDAVAPDDKEQARETVRAWLDDTAEESAKAHGAGKRTPERCVRINPWGTPLARPDLAAVVPGRPDTVVVPKAERWTDLVVLDLTLERMERQNGIEVGTIELVAIIESAAGVLAAERLSRATSRVTALAFGAEDLAADIGAVRSAGNMEVWYARSHVAICAARAGLQAIDQVYVDIKDTEGLARETEEARALGYRGKMIIHPAQVAPVHDAFRPKEEEVAEARRLLAVVESSGIGAGGVVAFEGRMVDRPLIEQARRTVRSADSVR